MRGFVLLLSLLLLGCGGAGETPPVRKDKTSGWMVPSLLAGGSYQRITEHLLTHLKENGLSLRSLPPSYRSRAVAAPAYFQNAGLLLIPYPKRNAYERWLETMEVFEKVDCSERILTFILNYMLVVEVGLSLRILWKLNDRTHPEKEEHLAFLFAEGVLEAMARREPSIRREYADAAQFISTLFARTKMDIARLDYEGLLRWFAKNRTDLRRGAPLLALFRLALMKERAEAVAGTSQKTADWLTSYIIEPSKKLREKVRLFDPTLSVKSVYRGRQPSLTPSLRVHPRLASIRFDPHGRLLLSNFKNIYQWRRRGLLTLVSGEQAAFSPTSFVFLDGTLVFADGDILRFIDLRRKRVKNVDISDHLKPPSAVYNYGVIPICATTNRIYIADNIHRRVLSFDELGNYIRSFDVDGLVGGMVFTGGRLYITLANRHTVEYYSETTGKFITFAGVRDFEGHIDGVGVSALFNRPTDIAVANDGSLIVADSGNHAVRRITSDGEVTTIAGFVGGARDASAADARLFIPFSVAVNPRTGEIAVGESTTGRIAIISKGALRVTERTYDTVELTPPVDDVEVERLTDVIERAPLGFQLYSAYCKRGMRLAELKRFDDAINDVKKASSLIPFNIEAHICRGDIYLMQGEIEDAINAYTEAISIKERLPVSERCADPLYIKVYYLRALANLRCDDYDAALRDVEQALSYRSHSVSVLRYADVETRFLTDMLTLKGKILLQKGKAKEAEQVLSDAIRRARGLKEALLYRGIARIKLKEASEALSDLKQAMILDVRWAEPLYWLGKLYEETYDDPRKAIEYYRTHIILGGKHKSDSEGRIEALKRVLAGKTKEGTGGYTEEIIEDEEGRRWILRRYTNGKVEKIPFEEK